MNKDLLKLFFPPSTAPGGPEVSLDNDLIEKYMIASIADAIDSLPFMEEKVFKMLYLDDLSKAEVAGRLDLSIQSVKAYRAEAVRRIREKLLNKN